MAEIKQISDNLSVAGQITPEQLHQAVTSGFKSVINLRSPQEDGFLAEEHQQAESAGLKYTHIPLKPSEINEALATEILDNLDKLPKPILIHCASGVRAGFIAFMHLATRENLSVEQVFAKAEELGFNCDANPQLKQFLTDYVSQKSRGN